MGKSDGVRDAAVLSGCLYSLRKWAETIAELRSLGVLLDGIAFEISELERSDNLDPEERDRAFRSIRNCIGSINCKVRRMNTAFEGQIGAIERTIIGLQAQCTGTRQLSGSAGIGKAAVGGKEYHMGGKAR